MSPPSPFSTLVTIVAYITTVQRPEQGDVLSAEAKAEAPKEPRPSLDALSRTAALDQAEPQLLLSARHSADHTEYSEQLANYACGQHQDAGTADSQPTGEQSCERIVLKAWGAI